jgi:hypothetical protein
VISGLIVTVIGQSLDKNNGNWIVISFTDFVYFLSLKKYLIYNTFIYLILQLS